VSDLILHKENEAFIKFECDKGVAQELADYFTFFVPGYQFMPAYKNRLWDGKIRLVNRMTRMVYAGLAQRIKKFCDERGYTFSFDDEFLYDNVSVKEVEDFMKSLNLPDWLEIRDYQVDAIVKCLRSRRRTLLSPTS
jgi:hypothetical protein